MSDSERGAEERADGADPSRAEQLRAARLRALLAFAGTLIVCAGIYFFIQSLQQAPPGGCTTSSQCSDFGSECVHAPTGGYCTHACNRNEDCDPGMHCEVPPWEHGATRALCLHDSAKIGTN